MPALLLLGPFSRGRLSFDGTRTTEEPLKVTYDPEVDVLRILPSNVPIEGSDEDNPDVILDYDKAARRRPLICGVCDPPQGPLATGG